MIKRGKHSGSQRPLTDDTLLGSAYILLSDLISGESIGGTYPLFKAVVDRLGGQTIHVEIHKTVLSEATPTHKPLTDVGSCIEVLVSSSLVSRFHPIFQCHTLKMGEPSVFHIEISKNWEWPGDKA